MNIYVNRIEGKVVLSPSALTYTITVTDNFTANKIIQMQDGEVQKTNEQGQLLYKLNSFENDEVGEVWSETTDSRTVTQTIPTEVTNKWFDEDGVEHSNVVIVQTPVEWIDNTPVMIANMVSKSITHADDPTSFTAEEILKVKYQSLLDSSNYDYILADIFLNEEDIDLSDKDHAANTGVAIMQLLPNGQAKTKSITLVNSASSFELLELEGSGVDVYINDFKLVSNKATLATQTDTVVIKFVNTTNKLVDVKSYAIAY